VNRKNRNEDVRGADLVRRIGQGDAHALAEFIQEHRNKLLAALDRKVGAGLRRKLDLEDILQEVTARAIRDVGQIELDGRDPLGWLFQVMDRQIIDLHRYHFEAQKRDGKKEVSADRPLSGKSGGDQRGLADLLIASMTSPSAAVSRDMRLSLVYQALEGLSEDMRNAIRWRYLENLPSQEIAKRLDKSDAATRVLLSRALRKLQAALAES
jgi:RNA polymerase sigma-70 factor (ECF subfamily)